MGSNAETPRNILKTWELIVAALVSKAVSVPGQTVKGGHIYNYYYKPRRCVKNSRNSG
jgi:hypothetical protein